MSSSARIDPKGWEGWHVPTGGLTGIVDARRLPDVTPGTSNVCDVIEWLPEPLPVAGTGAGGCTRPADRPADPACRARGHQSGTSPNAQLDGRYSGPLETTDSGCDPHIDSPRWGPADYDDYAPCLPAESQVRHRQWAARRNRVYRSLLRVGVSCRRTQNFANCGGTLWAVADGSELSLVCNRCHDRLCEPCQRERQGAVVEGVMLKCHDAGDALRFVTLTLRHVRTPLSQQIDRLLSSFKLLRNHPKLRGRMSGGAWFLEVKLDRYGRLWHPHLHIIVEGDFVSTDLLSAYWHEVTGDSYIVKILKIDDVAKRAQYVSKYSTKPLDPKVTLQPGKLDEFVQAIKGRRLYQCFGSWVGAVHREKLPPRKRKMVGHVHSLWQSALDGDSEALGIMRRLLGRYPALRHAYDIPPGYVPPEPDPP